MRHIVTSTHLVALYPGKTLANGDVDPPYFLASYTARAGLTLPQRLTAKHQLHTIPDATDVTRVGVRIGDKDVGFVEGSANIEALAGFASAWRQAVAQIDAGALYRQRKGSIVGDTKLARLRKGWKDIAVQKTLNMRVMTWNMYGQSLAGVNLDGLLGLPIMSDIYVLGLQESDPLNKNIVANTETLEATKRAVLAHLGADEYACVAHNQLLGLLMCVFVRKPLVEQVSDVAVDSSGTGLFGVWGNKGAVMVQMSLGADDVVPDTGARLVFVNCHLAAGDNAAALQRRRWELSVIEKKFGLSGLIGSSVIFDNDAQELSISDDMLAASDGKADAVQVRIYGKPDARRQTPEAATGRELLFLFGDLNYRVNMDPDMVKHFDAKRDYETIYNQDTLHNEIRENKVLPGLVEGEIRFSPSYKYVLGTDEYDARTPSFTDRIFYADDGSLRQTAYTSVGDYTISDHKPVVASFELTAELIDFDKRRDAVASALKELDIEENSHRPDVAVDPVEVELEDAVLSEMATHITLKNPDSSRLVEWSVVSPDGLVKIEPAKGMLPSGATQEVRVARTLGVKDRKVESILVVRIVGAKDTFVTATFKAYPTCLGASLDLLCHLPHGARNAMSQEPISNMPRELFNCVDYLWTHNTKDMFERDGDPALCKQVLEWMDTGSDFDTEVLSAANSVEPNAAIYAVAQQLLVLLSNLDGGIIPREYYYVVQRGREGASQILEAIPKVNVNVLIYLCGFLKHLIDTDFDDKRLLSRFERLLIAVPPDAPRSSRQRRDFLQACIDGFA